MSNDTYVQAWQINGSSYLEATGDPLAFNPDGGGSGRSLAAVLFKVNAAGFDATQVIAQGHLWGNISGNTGWALELLAVGADLVLQARVGNAGVPALVVLGSALGENSCVERLILATVLIDQNNDTVELYINGGRVATGSGTYVNSALNPRVGLDPAGGNGITATDIVGCAYLSDAFSDGAFLSGSNFLTSREDNAVGYVLRYFVGNYDYDHRYNAQNGPFFPFLNPNGTLAIFQGSNPTPSYFYLPTTVDDSKPILDVGNAGSAAIVGVTPITLTANGKIVVTTTRECDWFVPGGVGGDVPSGEAPVYVITTSYDILSVPGEQYLIVDLEAPNDAAKTLNLPAATNLMRIHIKAKGLANTFPITLNPLGTDKIDGLNADRVLMTDWGGWELVSDGISAWYLFVR